MILRQMPAIHHPGFRRWFYQRWGRENCVIAARTRHAEYPPFRQTLSVKAAWGGHEDYFVDGRRVSVHDDTFLILNEQRTYASCLRSVTPVTSFAVFFRPGMAAEVERCHALAPEVLLEHWHEPGPGVEFAEHSRRHDRLITPVLRFIRHHAEAGLTDESWYEEQLYFLLQRMQALHRRDLAAAALLPVRRAATRRELSRRLGLCIDFMHAHYARPVRLADIAAAGHLSPYYCLRLFQALHRTTPTRYLAGIRARTAVRLLAESTLPVEAIAARVGFDGRATLYRHLKRLHGRSPRSVRQQAVSR